MIGDRMETDVRMGLQAGMDTALTLTGATLISDLTASTIRPDYVIQRLEELLPQRHGR